MLYRLGELFCGPGGIARGALDAQVLVGDETHSIAHAWANDYDADTCQTYKSNICQNELKSSVYCEDVRKFVKRLNKNTLEKIDIFAYGFPCNDFSIVGESKGFDGEFGPLYTYGLNVIDKFKPVAFVAENVGGIRSANQGMAFFQILSDLERAGNGYDLSVNLYRAEEYGVPQARHRIVIVGIDSSLGLEFKVPAPTTADPKKQKSAKQALSGISRNAPNNELTAQSQAVIRRLKHIKPGENVWNADLPEDLKLKVKGARLSQIYRRLHPDRPAYTITGSGGGGTHCYHWSEPRALTNRERARLQTFPDDFVFSGKKESVRKQIGMAVPPQLAKVIFEAILKTLANQTYNYVEPNLKLDHESIRDLRGLIEQ
ncbi:MAG: DNA cytosine methyltransferase [Desulfuromonas sp.]|nr:DNA cytosine methyltransferase [Desulfuromonas sp.]